MAIDLFENYVEKRGLDLEESKDLNLLELLRKNLLEAYDRLQDDPMNHIKAYEIAFQEVIENIWPDHAWWQVVDHFDIFGHLFFGEGRFDPVKTIDAICDHVQPQFLEGEKSLEEAKVSKKEELLKRLQSVVQNTNSIGLKRTKDLVKGFEQAILAVVPHQNVRATLNGFDIEKDLVFGDGRTDVMDTIESIINHIDPKLLESCNVCEEALDNEQGWNEFVKNHPDFNKNFDNKKFGKYFDEDGKLIPEYEGEFFKVYREENSKLDEDLNLDQKFVDVLNNTIDQAFENGELSGEGSYAKLDGDCIVVKCFGGYDIKPLEKIIRQFLNNFKHNCEIVVDGNFIKICKNVDEKLIGDVNLNIDASGQSVGLLGGTGGSVTNEALAGDLNLNIDARGQSVGILKGQGGSVINKAEEDLDEYLEPVDSFKTFEFADKTNQGFDIIKTFLDRDDSRIHVIAKNPHRDSHAYNIGLGYSMDKGYWGQGWYDYETPEDAEADLKAAYNVTEYPIQNEDRVDEILGTIGSIGAVVTANNVINKAFGEDLEESFKNSYQILVCDGNGAASRGTESDNYFTVEVEAESFEEALREKFEEIFGEELTDYFDEDELNDPSFSIWGYIQNHFDITGGDPFIVAVKENGQEIYNEVIYGDGHWGDYERELDVEEVIDWLSEHEQAFIDFENYFENRLDGDVLTLEEIKGWISEHEQLAKDFEAHFGVKILEEKKSVEESINEAFDEDEFMEEGRGLNNDLAFDGGPVLTFKEYCKNFSKSAVKNHKDLIEELYEDYLNLVNDGIEPDGNGLDDGDLGDRGDTRAGFELIIEDGVLRGFEGKCPSNVTIPDSVTSIGKGAFLYCSKLKSITIPDSITSIGSDAFGGCDSLKSITIPNSVTSIGDHAFRGCDSLKSITIPNSVTSIGEYAFTRCDELTSVIIENGVTSIGEGAFMGCSSLTSITIPNSVTSIGEDAFYGCSSLTIYCEAESQPESWNHKFKGKIIWGYKKSAAEELEKPLREEYFHNDEDEFMEEGRGLNNDLAFDGGPVLTFKEYCKNFSKADIKKHRDLIEELYEDYLYLVNDGIEPDGNDLDDDGLDDRGNTGAGFKLIIENGVLKGFKGKRPSSITIPDSVTSIGGGAFYCCDPLTSVTIPDSVTSIDSSAFLGCSSLTSITIPDNVTSIGAYAFAYCYSLESITIPDSVTIIGKEAFCKCRSLTIYCEAESQPESWNDRWNCGFEGKIIWGCKKSTAEELEKPLREGKENIYRIAGWTSPMGSNGPFPTDVYQILVKESDLVNQLEDKIYFLNFEEFLEKHNGNYIEAMKEFAQEAANGDDDGLFQVVVNGKYLLKPDLKFIKTYFDFNIKDLKVDKEFYLEDAGRNIYNLEESKKPLREGSPDREEQRVLEKEISDLLISEHMYSDVWFENQIIASCLCIRVDGDWKHDHLFTDYLVKNYLEKRGYDYFASEKDVEDSYDDSYESTHVYVLFKKASDEIKGGPERPTEVITSDEE